MLEPIKRILTVALKIYPPFQLANEMKNVKVSVMMDGIMLSSKAFGLNGSQSLILKGDENNCLVMLEISPYKPCHIYASTMIANPYGFGVFNNDESCFFGYEQRVVEAGKDDLVLNMRIEHFELYKLTASTHFLKKSA